MAMLAEPRRKKKYNLCPRKALYEDDSRFGTKMLEKMGWSKGKGLGAKEDGSRDFIHIRIKNDSEGLGYEDRNDQWTVHEEGFNGLLKSLNGEGEDNGKENDNGNASESEEEVRPMGFGFKPEPAEAETTKANTLKDKISGISLEEKSKYSKARVHYKKFTRGKDLSLYSEKDLANIFGKKVTSTDSTVNGPDSYLPELPDSTKNDEAESENEKELNPNFAGVHTISTGVSVTDYFKLKLEALRNKQNNSEKLNISETEFVDNMESEKKKRKLKTAEAVEQFVEELPVKKQKKKKSKKQEEVEVVEDTVVVEEVRKEKKKKKITADEVVEEPQPAEEKKKKRKKERVEELVVAVPMEEIKEKKKKSKRAEEIIDKEEEELPKSKKKKTKANEIILDDAMNVEEEEPKKKKSKNKDKQKIDDEIVQKNEDEMVTDEVEYRKKSKKVKKLEAHDDSSDKPKKSKNKKESEVSATSSDDDSDNTDSDTDNVINNTESESLTPELLHEKLDSFNLYTISSFCAEKFHLFNMKAYCNSTISTIGGYGYDENIKLKILETKLDARRIINMWEGRTNKYKNERFQKYDPKKFKVMMKRKAFSGISGI